MTDDRLRAAERAWRDARDDEAAARYLRELRRLGQVDDRALDLAALLGYAPARELLGGAAPAEPEDDEWPAAVAAATAALGPMPCLRAAVEAAFMVPIMVPMHDRFDGPDDHALRVLEALDDGMLAPPEQRRLAFDRVVEVVSEPGGWGGYEVINMVQVALAIASEPENAESLLRDGLTLLRRCAGRSAQEQGAGALARLVLGLEDPPAERRRRRGQRFGAEPELVRAIAFSPDGARVVTTCRTGFVSVRDAASGAPVRVLRGKVTDLFAAAFTRDGARVLVAGLDGQVTLWDPLAGEAGEADASWPAHPDGVTCLAVLPDGRVVTAGYDRVARVWSPPARSGGGAALLVLEGHHERSIQALALSPDGALAATGDGEGRVVAWDLASGEVRWIATQTSGVSGAAFILDGAHLITAGDDGHLRRFDAATGQELAAHRVGARSIYDLALSPDGALAATVCDGAVRLTELEHGTLVREWDTPGVQLAVAFSPDGRWIVAGARTGALRRFQVTDD